MEDNNRAARWGFYPSVCAFITQQCLGAQHVVLQWINTHTKKVLKKVIRPLWGNGSYWTFRRDDKLDNFCKLATFLKRDSLFWRCWSDHTSLINRWNLPVAMELMLTSHFKSCTWRTSCLELQSLFLTSETAADKSTSCDKSICETANCNFNKIDKLDRHRNFNLL